MVAGIYFIQSMQLYTDTLKKPPLYIYVNLLKNERSFFIQLFCFKRCDYLTMLWPKTNSSSAHLRGNDNAASTNYASKLRMSQNQYLAAHPCLTERTSY